MEDDPFLQTPPDIAPPSPSDTLEESEKSGGHLRGSDKLADNPVLDLQILIGSKDEGKLESAQRENEGLQTAVSQHLSTIRRLEEETERLRIQLEKTMSQASDAEQLREKTGVQEKQIQFMKNKAEETEKLLQDLQAQFNARDAEAAQVRESEESPQAEALLELRNQVSFLKTEKIWRQNLLVEVQRRLKEQDAEMERLRTTTAQLRVSRDEEAQKGREAKEMRLAAEKQAEDATNELLATLKLADNLKRELEEVRQQRAVLASTAQQQIAQLNADKRAADARVEELHVKNKQLSKILKQERLLQADSIARLREELQQAYDQHSRYVQQHADQQAVELDAQRRDLLRKVAELEERLAQAGRDHASLQQQLQQQIISTKQQCAAVELLRQQFGDQRQQFDAEQSLLQDQCRQKVQNCQDELQKVSQKFAEMQAQSQKLSDQLREREEQHVQAEQRASRFQQEIEELRARLEKKAKELADAEQEILRLQQQLQDSSYQIAARQNQLQQTQKFADSAKAQLLIVRQKAEHTETQNKALVAKLGLLEQQLAQAQAQLDKIPKLQAMVRQQQKIAAQKEIERLQALGNLQQLRQQKAEEDEKLKQNHTKLVKQHEKLAKEFCIQQQTKGELEEQVRILKKQIAELEAAKTLLQQQVSSVNQKEQMADSVITAAQREAKSVRQLSEERGVHKDILISQLNKRLTEVQAAFDAETRLKHAAMREVEALKTLKDGAGMTQLQLRYEDLLTHARTLDCLNKNLVGNLYLLLKEAEVEKENTAAVASRLLQGIQVKLNPAEKLAVLARQIGQYQETISLLEKRNAELAFIFQLVDATDV